MANYLKELIKAINSGRCYHAFKGQNYVGSCTSERVAECYKIGGYRVIYLTGGK